MVNIAASIDPYPDELVYSILARFQSRCDVKSTKLFSMCCFGTPHCIATKELPSHINALISQIFKNSSWDADKLIFSHTLWPYFSTFLPQCRREKILADIKNGNGTAIHTTAGIMASQIKRENGLKFCPSCVQEDRNLFGEAYWHRAHQLPGVLVCTHHNDILQVFERNFSFFIGRQSYYSLDDIPQNHVIPDFPVSLHVRQLAEFSNWLLQNAIINLDYNLIILKYRDLLYRRKFCNFSGTIFSVQKFSEEFQSFFGKDVMKKLSCEFLSNEKNWLVDLIRGKRILVHPLKHLLVMSFLEISPQDIQDINLPAPFGNPPWPCLNPVCANYQKGAIHQVRIIKSKYTNGRPIGEFACECGFVYQRTGPIQGNNGEAFRTGRVVNYGPIWHEQLNILWQDPSMSLRNIARALGVDSATVKSHAFQLGLSFPRNGKGRGTTKPALPVDQPRKNLDEQNVRHYRFLWLERASRSDEGSLAQLRKDLPAVYAWLYRHDHDWLISQNKIFFHHSSRQTKSRIDWRLRDLEIAAQIREASYEVLRLPGKPKRVTFSLLGHKIGKNSLLEKHVQKMPISKSVLEEVVESREAFAIRKIHWAYQQLREQGIDDPPKWQVVRASGCGRLEKVPEIKKILEDLCG